MSDIDLHEPFAPVNGIKYVDAFSKYELSNEQKRKKWEPKKLLPIHIKMLLLFLNGHSMKSISEATGYSYLRVSVVINSRLGREFLARGYERADREWAALLPSAVSAVRDVLHRGPDGLRLKAADMVLTAQGRMGNDSKKSETAEDVIARAMALVDKGLDVANTAIRAVPQGDGSGEGEILDVTPTKED